MGHGNDRCSNRKGNGPMPSLTFVLPHWLYWAGLVIFPLFAMYMVRRQELFPRRNEVSLGLGYLFLVTGGFVGIHRFYARSRLGVIYIPLFLAILYGNMRGRQARNGVSDARNDKLIAEFDMERAQKAVDGGKEGADAILSNAQDSLVEATERFASSTDTFDMWQNFSLGFAIAIGVLLLIDAFLLPGLVRRCAERERLEGPAHPEPVELPSEAPHGIPAVSGSIWMPRRVAGGIDIFNGWSGNFVAYWSIIAVYVYYYEVIARYVFNSPTNWAHEAMFLMFGMQYLLSGAFAYREESHVRVDVLYHQFSDRAKAKLNLITSIFFFVFALALFWTGLTFFRDSFDVFEVSFTEWAIQYWPVKATIALGAILILFQGVAKLIQDISLVMQKEA